VKVLEAICFWLLVVVLIILGALEVMFLLPIAVMGALWEKKK
jgi:hypothetical protein